MQDTVVGSSYYWFNPRKSQLQFEILAATCEMQTSYTYSEVSETTSLTNRVYKSSSNNASSCLAILGDNARAEVVGVWSETDQTPHPTPLAHL